MANGVQTLIDRTLLDMGVVATGETPGTTERSDALVRLNDMIALWRLQRLMQFVVERKAAFTLTANQASHTIAASGANLAATRPIRIHGAGYKAVGSSNEDPLGILTLEQWQLVRDKTLTGKPSALYYEADNTSSAGKIFLTPIQDEAGTLVLYLEQQLSSALALADDLTLPPGYEAAIRKNLFLELAPGYGKPVTQLDITAARDALGFIKSANMPRMERRCDPALVGGGGGASNNVSALLSGS